MTTADHSILSARAAEYCGKAEDGIPQSLGFLTPAEQYALSRQVKEASDGGRLFFWGGCRGAERKCAFFLPDYYLPGEVMSEEAAADYIFDCAADFIGECVAALRIKGSGYRELTHRDYLGSILALGIERHCVGDICAVSPHEAVIFVSAKIVPHLLLSIERIGSDAVSVSRITDPDPNFDTGRKFLEVTVTAASARLDCAVRALTNKGSREDAVNLIESGRVELNYSPEYRIEKHISSGDALTIRGVGKFIIDSSDEETKRKRIKIKARKYL